MMHLSLMKVALAALLLSLTSFPASAQDSPIMQEELQEPLDINSADATAIAAALDGIGLVKAQEIVAYREMFGHFRSVDELLEVQGIGIATLEKNRQRILVIMP